MEGLRWYTSRIKYRNFFIMRSGYSPEEQRAAGSMEGRESATEKMERMSESFAHQLLGSNADPADIAVVGVAAKTYAAKNRIPPSGGDARKRWVAAALFALATALGGATAIHRNGLQRASGEGEAPRSEALHQNRRQVSQESTSLQFRIDQGRTAAFAIAQEQLHTMVVNRDFGISDQLGHPQYRDTTMNDTRNEGTLMGRQTPEMVRDMQNAFFGQLTHAEVESIQGNPALSRELTKSLYDMCIQAANAELAQLHTSNKDPHSRAILLRTGFLNAYLSALAQLPQVASSV